jgi:hypothetical protein
LQAIGGDLDLFTIPCRPPGVDIAAHRQKAVNDIVNNKELLDKATISVDDLPKNQQGEVITDDLSTLPKTWPWIKLAPWILGGLALLAGVGMVMLNNDKRRALKSLAVTFISIGVLLAIGFWLSISSSIA